MSCGLKSGGLKSGGLMSGGLNSYDLIFQLGFANSDDSARFCKL